MGTIAITGAAGGIGRATRARLERDGHRVIGVDVRDVEVIADLSTPSGRAAMVDEVRRICDGVLDGVVAGAGVINVDEGLIVSINYFGAVATLLGLRPLLAGSDHASAVAIGSNSSTAQPGVAPEVADACLTDEEPAAIAVAQAHAGSGYAGSKLALARWVRRGVQRSRERSV
jgi:nucleoside-diphosphate-sugar epimerase